MRRSSVVQLTLLPMLATAAVAGIATADPPPTAAPSDPPTAEASVPPDYVGETPPSEAPPVLSPPGMTPTIIELDCDNDPNWRLRPDCNDDEDVYWYDGGVIRGGFGTYFYGGGGG